MNRLADIACCSVLSLIVAGGCSRYGSPSQPGLPTAESDHSIVNISVHAPPRIVAPFGGEVAVDVPFQNPSADVPLELTLKGKSCECVGFALSPQRIEPGGDGVITLKTKVGDGSALRNLVLDFETGLDEPRLMRFSVDVQSCPAIEFQPNVSPLLAVPFGKSKQFKFDVYLHQPEMAAEVESRFSTDGEEVAVTWTEGQGRIYEGVRRRVLHCIATVTVPPREQFEDAINMQTVKVKAEAGRQSAELRVLWIPQNLIQSHPETLLVNGRQSGTVEKTFSLEAEIPFRLISVQSENPNVQVQATLGQAQKRHQLRASMDVRPDDGSPRKSWIIATTDHPDEGTVRIPVYIFE